MTTLSLGHLENRIKSILSDKPKKLPPIAYGPSIEELVEFDLDLRDELIAQGWMQVPFSLRHLFRTEWVHKSELEQIRKDFCSFFDVPGMIEQKQD